MVTSGLCSPGKSKIKRLLECQGEDDWVLGTEPLTMADGELKRELIDIGELAVDSKNQEWMKRVKALQRFKGLMAGGSYTHSNFLLWMREYMKDQLNQAIQDLRSAVSKEACLSVMSLCRYLPPHLWEPMGDWFLNSLFKISVVTIAIISQSSARCLRYIISHGSITPRTLSVALDPVNFENKHATYRQTVYQTIFTIVHRVEAVDFSSRQFDFLVRAIRQGLNDPMPEVRRVARLLFWALNAKHPVRADNLYGQLDPSAQRIVADDAELYENLPSHTEVDWDLVAKEQSLRRPSGLSNSGEGVSPKKALIRSHSTNREPLTVPSKASRQRGENRSVTPVPQGHGPMNRSSPRVARGVRKSPLKKEANTTPSIGSTECGISSEALDEEAHSSSVHSNQDLSDITVEQAIAMGQSSDANNKAMCLEVLSRMAPTPQFRLVKAKLPSVMLSVLTLLRDPNLLVSSAAINTCSAFAVALQDSNMLEPYFERIFLVLFTKLGHSKTHGTAVSLLEKLLECGQTRVLFPILLKVLDSPNTQVQLGCLEYLLHLMNFSREYLSRGTVMRQALSKFLYLSGSTNQDVRKASATCLSVLFSVSGTVFAAEVSSLPSVDQASVCKIVPAVEELLTEKETSPVRSRGGVKQLNAALLDEVVEDPPERPERPASAPIRMKSPVRRVVKPTGRQTPTSTSRSVSQSEAKLRKAAAAPPTASLHAGHWGTVTSSSSSQAEKISSIRRILNDGVPWPNTQELASYLSRTTRSSSSLISSFGDDLLGTELRLSLIELGKRIVVRLCGAGMTAALKEYFRGVLNCYCDPEPKVSEHVEAVLHGLVGEADVKECLNVISMELSKRGAASQQEEIPLLLKLLEKAVMRMGEEAPKDLSAKAGVFVQSLYAGFGSDRAEVRKAVVFNFVTLYLSLGSKCVDLLKPLSTSQLKLITIYVNRKLGKSDIDLVHLP